MDNHLNDRGAFVPVRHATAGTRRFPGHAWRFEKTPGAVYRAAPMFAEHDFDVFHELLGLDDEAIREQEPAENDRPVAAPVEDGSNVVTVDFGRKK